MRRWGWRAAAVPAVVLIVVAALMLTGATESSAGYRTATATTGDVSQTLTTTGAIESASRSDVGFQVDGTVASVPVAVGDTVEAGDVLATLETDDLQDAVDDAQEALDDAEQALADDLDAQSSGSSSSASTVAYTGEPTDGATASATAVVYTTVAVVSESTRAAADTSDDDAVEDARQALLAAQQALLDQYDAAQALLEQAGDAQTQAQDVCAAFTGATSDGADATSADDGDGDTGDGGGSDDGADDGSASGVDTAAALADCQAATAAALDASQDSIAAQQELMDRTADVDDAVAAYQQALVDAATDGDDAEVTPTPDTSATEAPDASSTPTPGGDEGAPDQVTPDQGSDQCDASADQPSNQAGTGGGAAGASPDAGSASSGAAGGMAGSGQEAAVPSAEDILADKADITAAQADLAVAQQQLEHAQIAAPVAGEVVAVGLAEGDTVSAGDTDAVVTIVADNSYLVQLSVGLTDVALLEPGQDAQVTLTSSGDVVSGTVSSVSSVNSGNAYSQAYAVTVAIPDPGFDIRIGAATRMEITVAASTGVLVVPTSAVSNASGDASVQVVGDDGTAQTVQVTTGAVGATYTEITSGLAEGDQVILADLDQELTSDDDESDSSGGLLGGLDDGGDSDQQSQFPDGFTPPTGDRGAGGFQPPTMNG